jgi:hypothetical protein
VGVKVTKHSHGDIIIWFPGQKAGEAMSGIGDIMVEIDEA